MLGLVWRCATKGIHQVTSVACSILQLPKPVLPEKKINNRKKIEQGESEKRKEKKRSNSKEREKEKKWELKVHRVKLI